MIHSRYRLVALALSIGLIFHAEAQQPGPAQRVLGADDSIGKLAIVPKDGSVQWETKVTAIHDAWVLPNVNILCEQGSTHLFEAAPKKEVVWTIKG